MGILGTSNSALASQMNNNNDSNFKAMNNLLTLQDNHVEEFLLYHGEAFFTEFEKMMEDVVERVMSQMLAVLHFKFNILRLKDLVMDSNKLVIHRWEYNLEWEVKSLRTFKDNLLLVE